MSVVEEEAPPEGARLADRISAELELLSRNVDVLEQLSGRTPKGIIRLSEALHLPIHKVRHSLHLLEREGSSSRAPTGRSSPTRPGSSGSRSTARLTKWSAGSTT